MDTSSTPKSSFLDSFQDGHLSEWLTSHGKNIIYGLIALFAIIFIIYSFGSNQKVKQEQDYLQAANDFLAFTRPNPSQDATAKQEAFQRLTDIIARHPELHAAYDGAIAQALLNQNDIAAATPIINSTLARTRSDYLPLYADYAKTSLLISQENYSEALKNALVLQQTMTDALNTQSADARTFGEELFVLNLFRIGILQQKLGDKAGELATWHTWKQYAGLENAQSLPAKVDVQAFRAVIQQLAIGTFSLPDYIAYREKTLSK